MPVLAVGGCLSPVSGAETDMRFGVHGNPTAVGLDHEAGASSGDRTCDGCGLGCPGVWCAVDSDCRIAIQGHERVGGVVLVGPPGPRICDQYGSVAHPQR